MRATNISKHNEYLFLIIFNYVSTNYQKTQEDM